MANGYYSCYRTWQITVCACGSDTYSGFLIANAQIGEAIKHVHCLKCFRYIEIPKIIKMDNGSRYISKAFQQFCCQWNTEHRHSLQSSRIRNCGMYHTLKTQSQIIQKGSYTHIIITSCSPHFKCLKCGCPEQSAEGRFWRDGTCVCSNETEGSSQWIMQGSWP